MNIYRVITNSDQLQDFNLKVADGKNENLYLFLIGEICGILVVNAMLQKNARLNVRIATVLNGNSNLSLKYHATHSGELSNSSFELCGSLGECAHKSSELIITFKKGAVGAVGSEKEKILLLNEKSTNETSPQIDSHEENAKGTHGFSCGHLNADAVKYLTSRGFSIKQIRKLLIEADIRKISKGVKDKNVLKSIQKELQNV